MELKWTSKAVSGLARLHEFLAPVNKKAAARTVKSLTAAPARLLEHPRVGEKLEEFEPHEVHRSQASARTNPSAPEPDAAPKPQ